VFFTSEVPLCTPSSEHRSQRAASGDCLRKGLSTPPTLTINHQPSTLTINHQPSTLNPQPSTRNQGAGAMSLDDAMIVAWVGGWGLRFGV